MTYNQLTTEIFVERASKIHCDKYDYSKVNYVNGHTKVCIICPIHGEFWQIPSAHLGGQGCHKCADKKKGLHNISNTISFVEKAKKVHGEKFDYSKVEYKNAYTKVCIVCPKHGDFWQTPASHLSGRGCNLCSKPIHDTESFIEEAKKVHGDKYDYSKVNYVDGHTKVCIICPIHGEFWQTPNNHVRNRNCPKCGQISTHDKQALTTEQFIAKAKEVHGEKYDYSNVKYVNNHTDICIICPKHGEFWQKPAKHLVGHGCIKCGESKLESEVRVLLEENNIDYVQECDYTVFKWLKRQKLDFFLPEYNVAIECQGEQHYFPVSFGSLSEEKIKLRFKQIKKYDKAKKENCHTNGIRLLYYTRKELKCNEEFTSLDDLLKEIQKNG